MSLGQTKKTKKISHLFFLYPSLQNLLKTFFVLSIYNPLLKTNTCSPVVFDQVQHGRDLILVTKIKNLVKLAPTTYAKPTPTQVGHVQEYQPPICY